MVSSDGARTWTVVLHGTPDRTTAGGVTAELTGRRGRLAFDLMIVGDFLPSGLVTIPMIPCLAEPGPAGQIQMIPWWVVPMDPAKPLRDDLILLD